MHKLANHVNSAEYRAEPTPSAEVGELASNVTQSLKRALQDAERVEGMLKKPCTETQQELMVLRARVTELEKERDAQAALLNQFRSMLDKTPYRDGSTAEHEPSYSSQQEQHPETMTRSSGRTNVIDAEALTIIDLVTEDTDEEPVGAAVGHTEVEPEHEPELETSQSFAWFLYDSETEGQRRPFDDLTPEIQAMVKTTFETEFCSLPPDQVTELHSHYERRHQLYIKSFQQKNLEAMIRQGACFSAGVYDGGRIPTKVVDRACSKCIKKNRVCAVVELAEDTEMPRICLMPYKDEGGNDLGEFNSRVRWTGI